MRTEKQLLQLAEARKHIKHRPLSEETKRKIGVANSKGFKGTCDYCGIEYSTKESAYNRAKRHFCSRQCYSKYRAEMLPKEEQPSYGTGHSEQEREKRKKAREIFNHYMRDKHLVRKPCEVCGEQAEAHHDDYNKPLEVRWLCFKHHREWHKTHDNPELLEVDKSGI